MRNMTRISKTTSQLRSATRIDYILVSSHLTNHISPPKSVYVNFSDHNQVVTQFSIDPLTTNPPKQLWYKIIPSDSSSRQITNIMDRLIIPKNQESILKSWIGFKSKLVDAQKRKGSRTVRKTNARIRKLLNK